MAIEAYCVKCKAKKCRAVESVTKNSKPIMRNLPDCGGKMRALALLNNTRRAQLARGDVSRETSPFQNVGWTNGLSLITFSSIEM